MIEDNPSVINLQLIITIRHYFLFYSYSVMWTA